MLLYTFATLYLYQNHPVTYFLELITCKYRKFTHLCETYFVSRILLKIIEKLLIIVSQSKPKMQVTTISMSIILSIVNQDDNEHIMV